MTKINEPSNAGKIGTNPELSIGKLTGKAGGAVMGENLAENFDALKGKITSHPL